MISVKMLLRLSAFLFLMAGTANNVAAQKDSVTRVFVIRHAEKADDGSKDPSLSDLGRSRANALAKMLSKTPVHFIYSTPYKRTRETVEPLSTQSAITIKDYNPMDTVAIRSMVIQNEGKNLVFVGHSNTIPFILNSLTQSSRYKNLSETEFDNIWILFLKGSELIDLVHLTYQ